MTTIADSKRAFDVMAAAAQEVLADPTNIDKIQAARIATDAWKIVHSDALRDAGFPEGLDLGQDN